METNYSELLRAESGATVKAYLDYAIDKTYDLMGESKLDSDNTEHYDKEFDYWNNVIEDCKQELELRITKIFPR